MRPHLSTLPPGVRRLLRTAEAAASAQDARLWVVGGAVRDLALGRTVHDLDLTLDGDVARFARACAKELPDAQVAVTARFGTASLLAAGVHLDVARLRSETYERPGALPRVRATRSLERDLARRDFTVNAMALGVAGPERDVLADPFGGLDDLAARRLRVLHPRSFADDATRIWRGARTAALCRLRPDAETAALIADGVRWLDTISGERLWAELVFTARRGRAAAAADRLDAWGALPAIHPALRFHEASSRALRRRPRPLPAARLAAVLIAPLDRPRAVLDRFRVDRETRETVLETRRLLEAGPDLDALARLEGVREEARIAARWLDPAGQAERQRALRRWERTRPALSATELDRLGVPRGPALGRTLERLRRARFLGTLGTPTAARRAVRDQLERDAASGCDGTGEADEGRHT